jgi:hypothetical protein
LQLLKETPRNLRIAGVPIEILIQYFPNTSRESNLFGWISCSERFQMHRETPRSLRIADWPSGYKSDFVSLELVSWDSSAEACTFLYFVKNNLLLRQPPFPWLLGNDAAEQCNPSVTEVIYNARSYTSTPPFRHQIDMQIHSLCNFSVHSVS